MIDYVSKKTAEKLREVGYERPKESNIPEVSMKIGVRRKVWIPHLYDAQKWLREKHQIVIEIVWCASDEKSNTISPFVYNVMVHVKGDKTIYEKGKFYDDYELAIDAAIFKACSVLSLIGEPNRFYAYGKEENYIEIKNGMTL